MVGSRASCARKEGERRRSVEGRATVSDLHMQVARPTPHPTAHPDARGARPPPPSLAEQPALAGVEQRGCCKVCKKRVEEALVAACMPPPMGWCLSCGAWCALHAPAPSRWLRTGVARCGRHCVQQLLE